MYNIKYLDKFLEIINQLFQIFDLILLNKRIAVNIDLLIYINFKVNLTYVLKIDMYIYN